MSVEIRRRDGGTPAFFAPPEQSPRLGRALGASRTRVADAAHRARSTPAPTRALPRGVSPQAVEALARPQAADRLGARLDELFRAMQGPYSVDGQSVRVTPHFRSLLDTTRTSQPQALRFMQKVLGPERFRALAHQAARATSSRGFPEDVRAVTQALIDAGALRRYPGLAPERAIRQLMWDLGIGFDCRGYVIRAFLYARGSGQRPADGARHGMKDVTRVLFPTPGMKRVPVSQARAGDVIHLAPVEGRDHNVIVRSACVARADASGRVRANGHDVPAAFVRDGWPSGEPPTLRVLEVDSAWGGGVDGKFGGVERRTWVHNEKSDVWGYWDVGGEFRISRGPYDHALDGVFRPRGEP